MVVGGYGGVGWSGRGERGADKRSLHDVCHKTDVGREIEESDVKNTQRMRAATNSYI